MKQDKDLIFLSPSFLFDSDDHRFRLFKLDCGKKRRKNILKVSKSLEGNKLFHLQENFEFRSNLSPKRICE